MRVLLVCLLLLPGVARAATLKSDAVICLTKGQAEEAVQAMDRGDGKWLKSVRGCFGTKYPVEYRRLDCSFRVCQIRLWTEAGSSVVFVPRSELR